MGLSGTYKRRWKAGTERIDSCMGIVLGYEIGGIGTLRARLASFLEVARRQSPYYFMGNQPFQFMRVMLP